MEINTAKRSSSRNRPPSRPTTPLRPSSRTSLRESQTFTQGGKPSSTFPLESLEPAFAELSDSMADLEANFMHLQLMHESLSRFNENFASFLYGLNMNAFCVDFSEVCTRWLFSMRHVLDANMVLQAPIPESFRRARQADEGMGRDDRLFATSRPCLYPLQLHQRTQKATKRALSVRHLQSKTKKPPFCGSRWVQWFHQANESQSGLLTLHSSINPPQPKNRRNTQRPLLPPLGQARGLTSEGWVRLLVLEEVEVILEALEQAG